MSQADAADNSREVRLDALIALFYQQQEQGLHPDPPDWITKHPEFQTELKEFFANVAMLAPAAHSAESDSCLAATFLKPGQSASPEEMRLPAFPNYDVLEEIDRGGMGIVYKARQRRPNRIVAIKTMRQGRFAGPNDVERFMTEANAASQVDSESVVPVYEVGDVEGNPYIVMKYIDGESLQQLLNRDAVSLREALTILWKISSAIGRAHQIGIVHRDLKPANILIERHFGRPWVTDFGLAKFLDADQSLTAAGDVMGTPGYMSPEQASGKNKTTTPAADVYAIGAIIYRVLTGRTPIVADRSNIARTIQLIQDNEVVAPRSLNRRVAPDLNTLCVKCLETDPGRRYSNAQELADDLSRYLSGEAIHAKPPRVLVKLHRWARGRPGLAATGLVLLFFGTYHTTNAMLGGLDDYPVFRKTVNIVIPMAALNAWFWQQCLIRRLGPGWPLYAWATGEVFLLTLLLLFTDGARSGLVSLYFVITAASILRCRPLLVGYVALLAMVGYLITWAASRTTSPGTLDPLQGVPFLLSLGLVGLIQYLALRRSSSTLEFQQDPEQP